MLLGSIIHKWVFSECMFEEHQSVKLCVCIYIYLYTYNFYVSDVFAHHFSSTHVYIYIYIEPKTGKMSCCAEAYNVHFAFQ